MFDCSLIFLAIMRQESRLPTLEKNIKFLAFCSLIRNFALDIIF